jgi:hypothetical protein
MNPYLIPGLRSGPVVVRVLVTRLPEGVLDLPTAPERFTPREIVAHLADWEPILLERMRACAQDPGTAILTYDEGQMAEEKRYRDWEVEEALENWERDRAATADFLQNLPADTFAGGYGDHPQWGRLTLSDQANMLLGHDLYHVEQLTTALGS